MKSLLKFFFNAPKRQILITPVSLRYIDKGGPLFFSPDILSNDGGDTQHNVWLKVVIPSLSCLFGKRET